MAAIVNRHDNQNCPFNFADFTFWAMNFQPRQIRNRGCGRDFEPEATEKYLRLREIKLK